MKSVLLFYGFLSVVCGVRLFARTDRSLSIIDIDVIKRTSQSSVLVADLSEDLSVSLAVNVKDNIGYYTLRDVVYSVDLTNGSQHENGRIGFGLEEQPTSIAYEWITDKIYLSLPGFGHDNAARVLMCSSQNVSSCSVLLHTDLDYMYSLALDPLDGNMYWLNGIGRTIEKSFLDGKHHDKHPFDDSSGSLSGEGPTLSSLSIDLPSKRLFFVKTRDVISEIWSCDLYVRDSCRKEATIDQIVHIVTSSEFLIWSNSRGQLNMCRIDNCEDTDVLIKNTQGVETFVVVQEELQPERSSPNPCALSNGGCSHFCALVHFEPWMSCVCPIGVRLLEDEKTCDPDGIDKILLVSAVSGIYSITLDTPDFTPQAIPFEGHDKATHKLYDIDYDPLNKKIYWMDAEKQYIRRSNINGTETEDILPVPAGVKVFRVDYVNNNVYWVDAVRARVMMSNIANQFTRIVVSGRLRKPQGLALDLKNNHIYITEADEPRSRIERADMDGSNREILINLSAAAWPNGLVIDSEEQRLYWTEGNYSVIKTTEVNERNVTVIGPATQKLRQPYAITKLGNVIYCNSLAGRSLMRTEINEKSGEINSRVLESPIYGPIGMKAISLRENITVKSICSINNGGCAHICLSRESPISRKCLCGIGYELQSDGKSCRKPAAFAVLSFEENDSDVQRLSLGSIPNLSPLGVWNTTFPPIANEYDQKSGLLYLAGSNGQSGFILQTTLNGSSSSLILNGTSMKGIHSLSLDYVSKNLYWTNSITRRVEVCDVTGRFRRTIAWKDLNPTKILVYPPQRMLLVVDQGVNATIKRMPLGGHPYGGDDVIGDLTTVLSMTIDYKKELLYWAESEDHSATRISVSKLDGGHRETLFVGTDIRPHHIFSYNFKLYFADVLKGTFGFYDGKTFSVLHENIGKAKQLLIVHGQIPTESNACAYSKATCSELCLATKEDHHSPCQCRDHYVYDKVSKICRAPENMILIGSEGQFQSIKIRKLPDRKWTWNQDPSKIFSLEVSGSPIAFSMDLFSGILFWITDSDLQTTIRYARLDRPNQVHTIAHRLDCLQIHDLAVDELGRQLYVSCRATNGNSVVIVYKIQENSDDILEYLGTVVSGDSNSPATGYPAQPRSIALFPFHNYLFYVDVSPHLQSPAIIQCHLNGRKCQVWFATDLWPITRLHADPANLRLLYTCPTGVWSRDVGLSSSNVRHHFHSANATDYAVSPIDEDQVLVVEMTTGISKTLEVAKKIVLDLPQDITALHRFDISNGLSDVCRHSGCSHLCRVLRDSKQRFDCSCPLGYSISADNSSQCLRNVQCLPWEFACDDGRSCIHAARKCDRVAQCRDGSDESPRLCLNAGDQWPCDDGTGSVDRMMLCDGREHCDDGSDEKHCRCPSPADNFDCGANPLTASNDCVGRNRLCDAFSDCDNGMDEDGKMCFDHPRPTSAYQSSPEWFYYALTVVILTVVALFLCFCCFRNNCTFGATNNVPVNQYRLENGAEASILLPSSNGHTQYEVALRTYSLVESTSTYPALPPPNSVHTYSSSGLKSHRGDIPINRFYAPPPSAASLSTYGVVKPAEVRVPHVHTGGKRRRRQMSPPPTYSQADQTCLGSLTGLSQREPQMCSTPKSVRTNRSNSRPVHSGTPSRMGTLQRHCLDNPQNSPSLHEAPPPLNDSSSSLSSHSSEEGYSGRR